MKFFRDMLQTISSSLTVNLSEKVDEPYPFARIWINGRHTALDKIIEEKEIPLTAFEESTFKFIREWLRGETTFTLMTSGSTGEPKQIAISRTQMMRSASLTADRIQLQKNSTSLLCIDPRYIGGKMMIVRSLLFGLRIMAIDPSSNPLIRIPVDKCVQFAALVPYQIQSILESKHPHLLNNLDRILIGGAPLNAETREKLGRYQCACYETYGMTETVSHIATRLVNTAMKQPYFEVLPGVRISRDERDCLIVEADYLPDAIITNDIVEIVEPGRFVWLGRWDNVINTGGVKVVPEKVERQLEDIFRRNGFHHPFFIAALPDDKLGNKIVLIIEGVQFSSELLQRSLDELKVNSSPYETPREIYPVGTFIRTPTQKINRIQTLAKLALLPRP